MCEKDFEVKLISSDDEIFDVKYSIIKRSRLLKLVFNPANPFIEATERTARLPINSKHIASVLKYLNYANAFENKPNEALDFEIENQEAFQLLDISIYLQI